MRPLYTPFLCLLLSFPLAGQSALTESNLELRQQFQPKDSLFARPYVDMDVWRDTPVRHRYVHGGFEGTETRFSFYFPEAADYNGRFFQYITPVPDNEHLSQGATGEEDKIGFSISHGAYFVETNGGGPLGAGNPSTITAYRANAAAARFSRTVAQEIYGGARPYGYAFGGSGGAYRTIGGIELTDAWDGAVPYVAGSPMAIPNVFTVRMHAMRVLRDKLPQIADALEPGGSGDPYARLNEEETSALREVTRMGFPLDAWFNYENLGVHGFPAIFGGMKMADGAYFEDFWNLPGYLGHDDPASLQRDLLNERAVIAEVIGKRRAQELGLPSGSEAGRARGTADAAWQTLARNADTVPVALRLASTLPDIQFLGGELEVLSGTAEGKALAVEFVEDDLVILGAVNADVASTLRAGDSVLVSNSDYLAAQTYHRHQVPGPEYAVWDQFRAEDGSPLYPQRRMLVGPLFTRSTVGAMPSGKFTGKVILLGSLWDTEAYAWQSDWYRQRVRESLGDEAPDHFRLWFTDHANHGDVAVPGDPNYIVSYLGVLQQALLDLSDWVERGIEPAATSAYEVAEGQVLLPATAAERRGIQPVVRATVDGGKRVAVAPGEEVRLSADVSVPPGAGSIVEVAWDLDGSGEFITKEPISETDATNLSLERTISYPTPGTYFPTVRVVAQRDGDASTPFTRIYNLDRVRVVVK